MKGFTRASAAVVAVVVALVAASVGSAGDQTWYWSEYGAAHALYVNGIRWSNAFDSMRQTHCWGLGHWLVDSSGDRHFSHFYCTVWPKQDDQYNVIVNVSGPSTYAVAWAGYAQKTTWYWPAQMTADALAKNGIRWSSSTDPVSTDSCSPFGEWLRRDGYLYYKNFYCSVHSTARAPYTVVVTVSDKLLYAVHWVAFDTQLPAAPALPKPVTASSSTSGGASTTPSVASKALMDSILASSLLQSQREQAYRSFHNYSVPNAADSLTGADGCRSDPNYLSYAYSTYGAC